MSSGLLACRVVGQHRSNPTPWRQGPRARGDQAPATVEGDRRRAHPLGPADGPPHAAARGLERESQAGATDLAGGGPSAAH